MWTTRLIIARTGSCEPRPGERCSDKQPGACCPGRYEAVKTGEFEWSDVLSSWILLGMPLRSLSARAKYFLEGRASTVEDTPYLRHDCPYCGEPLPDLVACHVSRTVTFAELKP